MLTSTPLIIVITEELFSYLDEINKNNLKFNLDFLINAQQLSQFNQLSIILRTFLNSTSA